MSHSPSQALGSVSPAARRAVALASLLLLFAVLAVVLFTALRSPLKDDIAWLLYVAHRWMTGRELYVDVVEVNPPLIVWISAIPLQIAAWLDVGSQFVAMPFFIATVLGCAWWTATLLRPAGGMFSDRIPVFAAIGTVLLVVPAGDLGQREHLLVAAVLPYLVLFARSLDGARPELKSAILSGVLAGLGCALKPRYAGVFVVLEGLALLRGLRPWRAMPIAVGVTMAAYAGLVLLVCPAYLRRAVPLALALYGATDVPFPHLLLDSARLIFGEVVAIGLCWVRWSKLRERNLLLTLLAFSVTSTVICFVDGKDWFYHRLPATVVTVLALLCWGVSILIYRSQQERRTRLPVIAAGIAIVVFMVAAFQRLEPEVALAVEPDTSTVARLEELIRAQHAHTYIAFSEWIALGFPVVNNTGVTWASRFDSMWALKGELWRAHFDAKASTEWPIRRWVAHDFIAGCPDVAVVDTREGVNYIGVLSASDPAFARAWLRYRRIAAFDGLEVYRRAAGGCINPWVAAEASVAPIDRQ
ncbi:MAG: hypothetical protein P4L71_05065 [Acetobacteraceae bacterium]|nr:hypothetical protein [Acetobacteraceae bacterium]